MVGRSFCAGAGWLLAAVALTAGRVMAGPPADYMPIDYIQGKLTGKPYVNTGFIPNPQTDCIEAKVSFTSVDAAQAIWCARSNRTHNTWTAFQMAGGNLRFDYNSSGGSAKTGAGTPLQVGRVYTFTASNNSFRVSHGVSYDFPNVSTFTNTVYPLVFFCANDNDPDVADNRGSYSTGLRLHGVKIWRSGELVRDYVPYRTTDSRAVLWDRITDAAAPQVVDCWLGPERATNLSVRVGPQFIAGDRAVTPDLAVTETTTGRTLMKDEDYRIEWDSNTVPGLAHAHVWARYGSGTFGEMDVPFQIQRAVPEGCTPLEYIEGDGHSWLLTDYMPNPQTDKLKLDYELTKVETTAFTCARANNGGSSWCVCLIGSQSRFDYVTASGGGQNNHSGSLVTGARYSFTLENNELKFNDGTEHTATKNANFTGTVNPLQFYAFYVNGPNSGNRNTVSYYRTYRCQVWRSGELIHDWAPVRTAQGVATLADTVTGDVLTPLHDNTQGAAFIAGPAVARSFSTANVPIQTWDGSTPCTPALDVRDAASGVPLVAGTDYAVSYAGNNAPGTAYATVTGSGAYAGATSVVPFVVARAVPSDWETLEYIQGNNNSYFKTSYTPNPDQDRIEMNLELTQTGINAAPICARVSSIDRTYTVFLLSSGAIRVDYYNSTRIQTTADANLRTGQKYLMRYAGPVFDFGDDIHGAYYAKAGFTAASSELFLFCTSSHEYYSTHRLFDCSVWRDGAPLYLWVPVKTANDVVTLYDRMSGTTLTPSGTFLAGPKKAAFELYVRNQPYAAGGRFRPVVTATNTLTGAELVRGGDYVYTVSTNLAARWGRVTATGRTGTAYEGQVQTCDFEVYSALPEGYERLDYIQGDGNTVILTDITPTPTRDSIRTVFSLMDYGTHGAFCSRGTNGYDRSWSYCSIRDMYLKSRFDYNMNNTTFGASLMIGERTVLSVRNNQAELSNGDSLSIENSLAEAGGPLALLGYYAMNNGEPKFSTYSTMRMYSFRYWHDGALTLDLVPVRTPNGVVTMYDYVSGTALEPTARSGGAFIAGPVWELDPPPAPGVLIIVR